MDMMLNRPETVAGLPSPLAGCKNAADWYNVRRPEVLRLLEEKLFGEIPPRPASVRFEIKREKHDSFDGLATRREVVIHLENNGVEHTAEALWYLPNHRTGRIPAIVGLNFKGNAAASTETDIPADSTEFKPGEQAHRWQFPMLLKAGYSVVTAPRNSFFEDSGAGRAGSVFRLFHPASELTEGNRSLTAISAWAFGYSLLFDLAQTEPAIDPQRIWAHGHSRLGKTALWASAHDPRFAGVVSNDSGCCGASISREKNPSSENLAYIIKTFPHWFVPALDEYIDREAEMPFDQNWLAALTAPRPLLIASATEDTWSDPYNEYRCARAVGEVWNLFGAAGIGSAGFPAPDSPVFGDRVGYYLRTGIHDVTEADWRFVLEFIGKN